MGEHILPKRAGLLFTISKESLYPYLCRVEVPETSEAAPGQGSKGDQRGLASRCQPRSHFLPVWETLEAPVGQSAILLIFVREIGLLSSICVAEAPVARSTSDGQHRSIIEPSSGVSAMSGVCGMVLSEGSALHDNGTGT